MKLMIFCSFILFSLNIFAGDINGLDQSQVNDLNNCLSKRGLSFDQINEWENQANRGSNIDFSRPLFHNFNQNAYDSDYNDIQLFENSIFVSGRFQVNGKHSFKNSIISNVTFVGEYDKLDFTDACLVNVHFQQASWIELSKIRAQAKIAKKVQGK